MTYAELRRAIESLPLDDDEEVVIEVDVFHLWSGPGSEDELFTIGQVAYEEPTDGDTGFRAVLVAGQVEGDGIERKRYDVDHLWWAAPGGAAQVASR